MANEINKQVGYVKPWYAVFHSVSVRASILERFRVEIERQKEAEESLAAVLQAHAPDELESFLGENCIISNLLAHGQAVVELSYKQEFGSLKEFKAAMAQLETGWQDIVDIMIGKPSGGGIKVAFFAARPEP